ncbi:hypothetical protein [Pseudoduganella umbonata]|uniref:Uncharacterized protein n=1 Tax=Pseudoduganella umbonata TaxID=864828 RepID=A0A4P8HRR2_9BURK|nr:hypothetical protein [Pseudoduganella umbonata]MBB3224443.1 hypothetical protein [Pseudoduganella umbonata]QCP11200.1 hypothetical protein FCL38_12825 [Pseudoduganella umbonata]
MTALSRLPVLASSLLAMMMAVPGGHACAVPAGMQRVNAIEAEKIGRLLSLAKEPERIVPGSIERLFEARLVQHPCEASSWTCNWVQDSSDVASGITNVILPNPERGKYRTGGWLMLEIEKTSCIPLQEIAGRLQATPSVPSAPPTFLSFSPEDGAEPELMRVFSDIPDMDKQVEVIAWMARGCLVRLELKALIR